MLDAVPVERFGDYRHVEVVVQRRGRREPRFDARPDGLSHLVQAPERRGEGDVQEAQVGDHHGRAVLRKDGVLLVGDQGQEQVEAGEECRGAQEPPPPGRAEVHPDQYPCAVRDGQDAPRDRPPHELQHDFVPFRHRNPVLFHALLPRV